MIGATFVTDPAAQAPDQQLRVERVACRLRLATVILVLLMGAVFDPADRWLAVAAGAAGVGWSAFLVRTLGPSASAAEVHRLTGMSFWFDAGLALLTYLLFLPDPVATPVAVLPLMIFRLVARYGRPGTLAAITAFAGLLGLRIFLNAAVLPNGAVRPPLLVAWSLLAVAAVLLGQEVREARPGPPPAAEQEPPATGVRVGPDPDAPRLVRLADEVAAQVGAPAVPLTRREREILLLLGSGSSCAEVAARLYISVSTVRNHVHNMRDKLGIGSREELLALAGQVAARQPGERDRTSVAVSPR